MSKTVVFLMVSVTVLIVVAFANSGTIIDQDIPNGLVGNLAFLGALGLVRRNRRIRQNQAI